MGDYLLAVSIGIVAALALTIFSPPGDGVQIIESPFKVLHFENTALSQLNLVAEPAEEYDDPIKYAIEQVLVALTLAISVFLGIGILKLQLDHTYHMTQ